ncbi:exodeoxyribonuclease V subunit alpha [Janibacter sp. G56]|uniref:exodeoxyribonuclease V subunit alpha n=1 Tax=Janibacter sp. G56 TaxID=3418717 RepID=UPI003CFFB3A3
MTEPTAATLATLPPHDRRLARSAQGRLATLNATGALTAADVHIATTLARLAGEEDDLVVLACALAARAVREGSVGVDLGHVLPALATVLDEAGEPLVELGGGSDADSSADSETGPDSAGIATAWRDRVAASALAASGTLVVDLGLVYLQRYHHQEVAVCEALVARDAVAPPEVDEDVLAAGLERAFPGAGWAEQRAAAETAVRCRTTVLTGGPGTGKTTTVAGVLALVALQHARTGGRPLRVALAAPTGKAAARLQEAVASALASFGVVVTTGEVPTAEVSALAALRDVPAMTLHRLLGRRPGGGNRPRHDAMNRLPHDLVVVDEASMLSLTMTHRLLDAVRPDARLLLVGDPEQLVSVEAGAVLADLVAGLEDSADRGSTHTDGAETGSADTGPVARASAPSRVRVARLTTVHRYGDDIAALARALRAGDADAVVGCLRAGGSGVQFVEDDPVLHLRDELTRRAVDLRQAALRGDPAAALEALEQHRLLCAHRDGDHGVRTWNRRIERWLTEATGDPLRDPMYVGRPLLVTTNDYGLGVLNGDSGIVMEGPDGHPRAVIAGSSGDDASGAREFAVSRLGDVETMHALTIHKSQGSQAEQVTVLLPDEESALLTRELFYTAVTRAKATVRVVGSEATVRAAVTRRVQRASGLRERLRRVEEG